MRGGKAGAAPLAVVVATGLATLLASRPLSAQKRPATSAQKQPATPIQAEMRSVDFHLDATVVLRVEYLRGTLLPKAPATVPFFDDKNTLVFAIDTAFVSIKARALTDVLNRYVFAYPGSPLHDLRVSIEGNRLKQRAKTRGITVTTLNEVSVTPAGELRLHPVSVKAAGIPVRGLLHLFGIRLRSFVNLRGAKGVRFDGDDLLLNVSEVLPPPAIRGRLASVELHDSTMVQVFRPTTDVPVRPLAGSDLAEHNYMYFRGGTLRFGKLTMNGTDLLILDGDQRDPFDFFLDRYNDQLVAGYSRSTASKGLVTTMPDFADIARGDRSAGRPKSLTK